jgi:hypothetical protein
MRLRQREGQRRTQASFRRSLHSQRAQHRCTHSWPWLAHPERHAHMAYVLVCPSHVSFDGPGWPKRDRQTRQTQNAREHSIAL